MRRYINSSAAILVMLLVAALAGCGGGPASGPAKMAAPPPPVDEDLGRVLPAGMQIAFRLDVEQLRGSPIWEMTAVIRDLEELERLRTTTGIEFLDAVDEVLAVAADRQGKDGHFAAAIKGRFDARAAVDGIVAGGLGTAVDIRGRPAAAAEDLLVVALTERTLLLGSPAAVEEALAAAFDGGRALADDPDLAAVAGSKDAAALRFRRGAVVPDFSKFGAKRMPFDGIEQVTTLDGRLSVSAGISAAVTFGCATRLEASALAKDLRSARRDLARSPVALLLGVDWLFEKISVTTEIGDEGSWVEVALALDDNDVLQIRRLVERLRKIRELAGDSEPEPETETEGR